MAAKDTKTTDSNKAGKTSKRVRVAKESFADIAKRSNPERVLQRKYRQKLAHGFLAGLKAVLGPDNVVVDCGANIGEITGALAPTGAQIHAFEPDPYSFARLTENCGHYKNVHLYNQAVGVGKGSIKIYRKKGFEQDKEWNSLTTTTIVDETQRKNMEAIEVEQIDLEAFLVKLQKKHEITFLKMDIEGAELAILNRLVETDILPKIRATAVEIHPWLFKGKAGFRPLKLLAMQRPELNLNLDWY